MFWSKMIKCPACKRKISKDAYSCPGCGHPIQNASSAKRMIKCPACKHEISSSAKSCPQCGKPVAPLRKGKSTSASVMDHIDAANALGDAIDDAIMATKVGRGCFKIVVTLALASCAFCAIIFVIAMLGLLPYRLPESEYQQAMSQCSKLIEQRAEFGFTWTRQAFKERFTEAYWKDGYEDEVVRLSGNRVEFMDKSGKANRVGYTCEYNIITHQAERVTLDNRK